MDVSTLLADPIAISLEAFVSRQNLIILRVRAVQKAVCCPLCNEPSSSLHSRYVRRIADLPWHGVAIRLELNTRKFRCRNELCHRRIFCERLPQVVQSYARQTDRREGTCDKPTQSHLTGNICIADSYSSATSESAISR